jgi:hypothetical protein
MSAATWLKEKLSRYLCIAEKEQFIQCLARQDISIVRLLQLEHYNADGTLKENANDEAAESLKRNKLKILLDGIPDHVIYKFLIRPQSVHSLSLEDQIIYMESLVKFNAALREPERNKLITYYLSRITALTAKVTKDQPRLGEMEKKLRNSSPFDSNEILLYLSVCQAFWRMVHRCDVLSTIAEANDPENDEEITESQRMVKLLDAIDAELDSSSMFRANHLKQQYLETINAEFGCKENYVTFGEVARKIALQNECQFRKSALLIDLQRHRKCIENYEKILEFLLRCRFVADK